MSKFLKGGKDDLGIFPLKKGGVSLTSGTIIGAQMVYCVSAGNIIITWNDTTTTTLGLTAGMFFGVVDANSIQVSTGTHHVS
jgi:hypothetical protein